MSEVSVKWSFCLSNRRWPISQYATAPTGQKSHRSRGHPGFGGYYAEFVRSFITNPCRWPARLAKLTAAFFHISLQPTDNMGFSGAAGED